MRRTSDDAREIDGSLTPISPTVYKHRQPKHGGAVSNATGSDAGRFLITSVGRVSLRACPGDRFLQGEVVHPPLHRQLQTHRRACARLEAWLQRRARQPLASRRRDVNFFVSFQKASATRRIWTGSATTSGS